MTKFKKFFSQMAVILAATTAYPTLSQELPASAAVTPLISAIELNIEKINVQEQVKAVLVTETQQQLAATLLAMNEEERSQAENTQGE